jgi:transcriptional regulator with XRE-family HTH domain
MKISALMPEHEILRELGSRLARARKRQKLSQAELAEEAGIGVATLRRIESGQDSQLVSWLKLMKTLERMPAIEALLPEEIRSPRAEVSGVKHRHKKTDNTPGIVWGDEIQ